SKTDMRDRQYVRVEAWIPEGVFRQQVLADAGREPLGFPETGHGLFARDRAGGRLVVIAVDAHHELVLRYATLERARRHRAHAVYTPGGAGRHRNREVRGVPLRLLSLRPHAREIERGVDDAGLDVSADGERGPHRSG